MINYKSPVIFIIDSHPTQRLILENCFRALGHKQIFSFTNAEACAKFDGNSADIIVLEQIFGENNMQGTDFMWKYKKLNPAAEFFFYTNLKDVDTASLALKLGANDFIIKSLKGIEKLATNIEKFVCEQRRKIESVSKNLIAV